MPIKYLKKSPKTSSTDDVKTHELVQGILKDLETSKENGCIELTKKFDSQTPSLKRRLLSDPPK